MMSRTERPSRGLRWLPRLVVAGLLLVVAASAVARRPNLRPTDLQRGEELYERHCVACHGSYGRGDGAASSSLVGGVPDLTGRVPDSADMEELVALVQGGRRAMPGYASSFDRYDSRRVLRYVRRLDEEEREDQLIEPLLGDWALESREFKTVREAVGGLKGKRKEEADAFTNALRAGLEVELREGEWQNRGRGRSARWDWRFRTEEAGRLKLAFEGEKGEFDLWLELREEDLVVTIEGVELTYGRSKRGQPLSPRPAPIPVPPRKEAETP